MRKEQSIEPRIAEREEITLGELLHEYLERHARRVRNLKP